MAKKSPLPLSDVLKALDKKDRGFYNRLTPEQKKAFSPWILLRYASTVQETPEHYIFMTNEVLNCNYMDIKDPELQWLLLSVIGTGKVRTHNWLKAPHTLRKTDKLSKMLAEIFPHMKQDEIDLLKTINSKEELKQLAEDYGYSDKDIKGIFK